MSFEKRRRLNQALELSLDYILGRQQSDGSWVDWKLPPGESSIWATAYVGCKLKNLPAYFRKRTQLPMHAASRWLLGKMFPDGGWGYTEQTGSDADSTALAILFLSAEGKTVPGSCYSFLQTLQHPDGGFSTYPRNGIAGSWSVSHGDVTPTVILALLTKYGRQAEIVERGIDYVIKTQTSSGVWESFWWTSFLYSTEASLALMNVIGLKMDAVQTRGTLLNSVCKGAFEKALLISSLVHLDPQLTDSESWRLIDELLNVQGYDGSWRSCSILRVTRRDCFQPWRPGDSDTLFTDTNRLFTTSTAIETLSRVYALLEPPKTFT
jgi:squalene cyclase